MGRWIVVIVGLVVGMMASWACASSDEGSVAYADAFEAINGRFVDSVEKYELLMAQAEVDPSLRGDAGWRGELVACFSAWGETADELRAQRVPQQYGEAHVTWLTGADHYTRAGELMRAALGSPTQDLPEDVAAELSLGQEYLAMAEAMLEEVPQ